MATPDTLVYTWNGRAILRDTLSNLEQSGIVQRFDTTWNASIIYGYLTDSRDNQVYRTVKIGIQTWMAENLNFAPANDSSWAYEDSPDSAIKYGRLYRWAAVLGLNDSCNRTICSTQVTRAQRGICPAGWRVPRAEEWDSLSAFAAKYGREGLILRSKYGWSYKREFIPKDSLGFRGLPGGQRNIVPGLTDSKAFSSTSEDATWWNATEEDGYSSYANYLGYDSPDLGHGGTNKSLSYSCRCIKD